MKRLPIHEKRGEILETIDDNQVVIIVGETGSGKTTQVPQFLYEADYAKNGMIGITEPRRIAATSVAKFVGENIDKKGVVGHQVRFDKTVGNDSKVKFMTDGILLREIQEDTSLSKYSVIVIDEAHERSVNIDLLLGLIKDLLSRRKDLRLIVSSATINAKLFSNYFDGAPVINVEGRTYPVETFYSDTDCEEEDLVDAVLDRVSTIHRTMEDGDVLVFTHGAEVIDKITNKLEDNLSGVVVLPAHGSLSPQEQGKIFKSYKERKIIVATNIAETSLTIDGVVYVVDTGFVKETHFHPELGIQSLDVVHHSKAGCNQRAGRAGRTRPGKCFRLFTEETFDELPDFTEPEILRTELSSVVLQMEKIGIDDPEGFDLLESPEKLAFHEAYQTLISIGAIDGESRSITKLGRKMMDIPAEPRISRMILEAQEHGCEMEIVTIASFLSTKSVYFRPKDKQREADMAHWVFKQSGSDALAYLAIWNGYYQSGWDWNWCRKNFLNHKVLDEVREIRAQLLKHLAPRDLRSQWEGKGISSNEDPEAIRRCYAAGLITNLVEDAGFHSHKGILRDLDGVYIHPSSANFKSFESRSNYRVFVRAMETTKLFAHGVSPVEVEWLPELAPSRFFFGLPSFKVIDEDSVQISLPVKTMRETLFEGKTEQIIGHKVGILSLERARKMQEDAIRLAEERGLQPFTFHTGMENGWMTRMITNYAGREIRAKHGDIYPEEGDTYYGKVVHNRTTSREEVEIYFKVLPPLSSESEKEESFPEVKEEPVPEKQAENPASQKIRQNPIVQDTPSEEALGELASMFGPRR